MGHILCSCNNLICALREVHVAIEYQGVGLHWWALVCLCRDLFSLSLSAVVGFETVRAPDRAMGTMRLPRRHVLVVLGLMASLRGGFAAFVQLTGPKLFGTTMRAAVCQRPASTSALNRVLQLRCRTPQNSVAGSRMQVLSPMNDFEGQDTLVMKPRRGAVSSSARFPSSSLAPAEHAQTTRESEAPELQVHMLQVQKLIGQGKLEAAEDVYSDLCTEFPQSGKLWMKRFKLARSQKLYGNAREVLQQSLKHNPCNAILWQAWADLERSLGRVNVARNLYRKGLEANPWLSSLYNSWGSMERGIGRIEAARQLYQQGLTHNANSVRLLLSSGVLEDIDGHPELARSLFRRGLLVEPGNSFLLHALGMLEYKAGDVAGAREAFRAAVQADSDHTQSWLAWGQLEEANGNIGIARSLYADGCKACAGRGTVQLWQAWARLEEKNSDMRAALDVYRRAIVLFRHDSKLLVECAKMLAKVGDAAEASTLLRRALDIDAYNPYVYQILANIEISQHRYAEALRLFAAGVAMAEKGFSKSFGPEGGAGAGMSITGAEGGGDVAVPARDPRVEGLGATIGKRELSGLIHTWATFEDRYGGDINVTRALFARAVSLDSDRVSTCISGCICACPCDLCV